MQTNSLRNFNLMLSRYSTADRDYRINEDVILSEVFLSNTKKHAVEGSPECAPIRKGIVHQQFAHRLVWANLVISIFWRSFDSTFLRVAQECYAQDDNLELWT